METCTKRQLLWLIGKFACKVIPAGHIFHLTTTETHLHHLVTIGWEAKLDLVWWLDFLPSWSGTSLILESQWTNSLTMNLYTDALGSDGWGAYWNGRWLQAHWSPAQLSLPILWKELLPLSMLLILGVTCGQKRKYCSTVTITQSWTTGVRVPLVTQQPWH